MQKPTMDLQKILDDKERASQPSLYPFHDWVSQLSAQLNRRLTPEVAAQLAAELAAAQMVALLAAELVGQQVEWIHVRSLQKIHLP